ncbi:MAG: phosphoribosylglycinamide formyltransferase [Calditrichaeota bacterium]|nr:phosphoribosylglycinamide formyltransferase [Calditrichota bacterium]
MEKLRIAIFASGRGSNFEAILKNVLSGKLNAEIVVVISNKKSAGALEIARQHEIPAYFISTKKYPDQEDFDKEVLRILSKREANFIALAGYLKMIGVEIVRRYRGRILNIHPALLPSFGGKGMFGNRVHEAVLAYGCKVSGVTVHLVDESYDTGPPVIQRCVPVADDDTPDTLAARVLKLEHQIFSEALQYFAEGRVQIEGRRVKILPEKK